jgi:aminomethyltransferase
VAGRQCSDFLAYSARSLQHGKERGIDPTTTRYQVGALYPMPGLASKYFDTDMQPLVEVIRDTCGRHDTFGLACTPRFYEDMGYPGHANCSENFNAVLAPYGLAARPGWPAINLYYNTAINAQNGIFLDDPWSRPGDYVLFQAMTDLVCGSSACPDDIDATNAWNPTDVHVRVYPASNVFSKAVATRMTPDAEPKLTRETGFHPRTSRLTRNFAEYRGYWLANQYNNHGPQDEYWACRERAVVLDLSALRKFEVTGPDAEELMSRTLTRNVRRLSPGQVVYSAMCYPSGGMIDDGTLFRMGPDLFRWIGGDDYGGLWLRKQAQELGLDKVWVKSSTDQLHNIAVQGPRSRDILKSIVWTPPARPRADEIAWFHFTVGRIGDYNGPAVVVSRTGYTGELGYEVWCHPRDALTVWDAVWQAGEPHGLTPLGLAALDVLRIESGLIFAGYEFDDQTDPFEAGIGFTVALAKNEDFIGRDALKRRKEHAQRRLVGLELEGNEAAGHGDCVHVGRMQVGVVTSGTRSPILEKTIALCRMHIDYAELGTEVEVGKIDGHQKRIPARVVRFPFYDPDKTRPRS